MTIICKKLKGIMFSYKFEFIYNFLKYKYKNHWKRGWKLYKFNTHIKVSLNVGGNKHSMDWGHELCKYGKAGTHFSVS